MLPITGEQGRIQEAFRAVVARMSVRPTRVAGVLHKVQPSAPHSRPVILHHESIRFIFVDQLGVGLARAVPQFDLPKMYGIESPLAS